MHQQSRSARLRRNSIEPLEARIAPAVIIVTNPTDAPQNGQVDLRQALATADQDLAMHPGVVNKIEFHLGKAAAHTETIVTLSGSSLGSNGDVDIIGPGAGKLIINGNNVSGVFNITGTAKPVSISGLSIVNGYRANGGGGIYTSEPLTLSSVVISGNFSKFYGAGINVTGLNANPTLTIVNSRITGNSPGVANTAGIYDYSGGSFTITGSVISGNNTGLHFLLNDNIAVTGTITKSSITGNAIHGIFAASLYANTKLDITGGNISGNGLTAPAEEGGGIFANTIQIKVAGSVIENNIAKYAGGGIYSHGTGSLTVTASTLSGNRVTIAPTSLSGNDGGGAIALLPDSGDSVVATITGSHITDNTTPTYGGGILVAGNTALAVKTSTISGNTATPTTSATRGGGIAGDGLLGYYPSLSVTGSVLSNNAAYVGAGISFISHRALTVTSTKLSGNSANGSAGIYDNGGQATITNCTITGNTAIQSAGGMDIAFSSDSSIKGGIISGNTCVDGGGGALLYDSTVSILGTKITGNSAGFGGGIFNDVTAGGHATVQASKVFANNAPTGADFADTPGDLSSFTFV